MTDLVERYVHQVGRYLAPNERKEITDELRSLIQDQLDDRYKGAPTDDDVAALLAELGEPRQMAKSYGREQYLIGPDLYPAMMYVLQRGWVLVPIIAILVKVLLSFLDGGSGTLVGLFLETAALVVQVVFTFTAIVVLLFAIFQHSGVELDQKEASFNPRELPPVNDPAAVDRAEVAFGAAFGTFGALLLLYFLRVGGLTLRFIPSGTTEVVPVPEGWLIALFATTAGSVVVNLLALRRGRWNATLLLAEAALGLLGAVAAYYVIIGPLFNGLFNAVPALANVPFISNGGLGIAIVAGFLSLLDPLGKLGKILFAGRDMPSVKFG